jgi:hypothetical protein
MANNKSIILAILLLFTCGRISHCLKIVLDRPLDDSGLFLSNSCSYADLPTYFEHSGCPLNPPASESLLASRYGFWSTCGTLSCDIIFDTGYLPSAKNASIGAYFDGHVSLSTWSKAKGDEEEWTLRSKDTQYEGASPNYGTLNLTLADFHVS